MEQTRTSQNSAPQPGDPGAAAESPEVRRLEGEVERLKGELRLEHETYLRNLADFDNYRRRVERERARAVTAGKRELILPLLDVMDDFERALAYSGESPQPVVEGLRAIHRRLVTLLEAHGVRAFTSEGRAFNPTLHEVVSLAGGDGEGSGTVLDELSPGYRWGDEVLRPARVRVAR